MHWREQVISLAHYQKEHEGGIKPKTNEALEKVKKEAIEGEGGAGSASSGLQL